MKQQPRILYTEEQKAWMRDRRAPHLPWPLVGSTAWTTAGVGQAQVNSWIDLELLKTSMQLLNG